MRENRGAFGFTLIELVIVIVILAILAAVAYPKYLDLVQGAEKSTVQGVVGAYATAVNIANANYRIQSNSSVGGNLLGGTNPDTWFNNNGWPVGAGDGTTAITVDAAITNTSLTSTELFTSCAYLFNNLLNTSSVRAAPNCSLNTNRGTVPSTAMTTPGTTTTETTIRQSFDYCVSPLSNNKQCVYAYMRNPNFGVLYTPLSGTVSLMQGQDLITITNQAAKTRATTGTETTTGNGTTTINSRTTVSPPAANSTAGVTMNSETATDTTGTEVITNTGTAEAPVMEGNTSGTTTDNSAHTENKTDNTGVVVMPSGVVVTPSGVVVTPQGVVITPSGTIVDPTTHQQKTPSSGGPHVPAP